MTKDLRDQIESARQQLGMTQAAMCDGIMPRGKYCAWKNYRVNRLDTVLVGLLLARVGLKVVQTNGKAR